MLADEDGEIVPYRREGKTWQRLALPPAERAKVGALTAGIYFGRDNRPRLMGYHSPPSGIVYLRFKDDSWRPELREIGPLGKDGPEPLFGVLGEADPEVVCRAGDRCLVKSRRGWKEATPSPVPTAVVRAFEGKGYAVTLDGVFRADDNHFVRVGPPPPWKAQPTGLWVGPGEAIAVVEPISGMIHSLENAGAKWTTEAAPLERPSDVVGPPSDRLVTGLDGLAHGDGARWSRVSGVNGPLDRVIVAAWGTIVGGRSGIFTVATQSAGAHD